MKNWLQDPNVKGLLLFLGILTLFALLTMVYKDLNAADKEPNVTEQMIIHLVKEAPRHPANKHSYRKNLAQCIDIASEKNGIPASLTTAVSFRESSFRPEAKGPGGEIGVMQVHPQTAKKFGCDMSTVYGQISCGCKVLKFGENKCGSLAGAVSVYGSKTARCKPKKNSKLERMVKDRMGLKKRLENKISDLLDV